MSVTVVAWSLLGTQSSTQLRWRRVLGECDRAGV